MIRHFLATALFAGLLAGLAVTGLQRATTAPLIMQAEVFEAAGARPAAAPTAAHDPATHDHGAAAAHEHGEDAGWAPADGAERLLFTTLANLIAGVGFAFILVACFALWNGPVNGRTGVMWGLAGFAVFTLAPSLGLPPELPATSAGDLMARQTWWIATAAATAAGLWLLVFPRKTWAAAAGIVALAMPHIIGAPRPADFSTLVPAELSAQFTAASIVTAAVFWACLGWLAGAFYARKPMTSKADGNLPRTA
jgi:cobalt transporter subunit CbtA